jgi:hypothetical protein
MLEKLKTLQTLLGKEDLVLTGSTALAFHGLMNMSDAHDLDLVLVNGSDLAVGVLDKLQAANPSKKHHAQSPVDYSFIYEGVKVDIWHLKAHGEKNYLLTSDGIKVSSISSIVKAKKSYNRPKDWVQLMQLSAKIFDNTEFTKVLHTVKTVDDSEYPESI